MNHNEYINLHTKFDIYVILNINMYLYINLSVLSNNNCYDKYCIESLLLIFNNIEIVT